VIVSTVCDAIEAQEQEQIEDIKAKQSADLTGALHENPILRLGLRGKPVSEYVRIKPNSWRAEQFVQDLALERYRVSNDLSKEIAKASNDVASYYQSIKGIVGRLDEGKKEALAEYVVHRRQILALVDAARRFDDNGERGSEDAVHSLIFRRFSDTTEVGYFEHNLWLIDDALAFLPYVSSDRTLHGSRRQTGDKVTDLVFFDDSMILGEEEGATLAIVEFKKPGRDDYRPGNVKSDPVMQVIQTLEQATAKGGISRKDGGHTSFANVTRRTAYIIADLTPSLLKVLKHHDFRNTFDPKIHVRYRDNEQIFIQAFGYDTLVSLAKRRNQAFFRVLMDE
jgi:hypothetical protein